MRLSKVILNILIISLLVILQISFFSHWKYLNYLNLILSLTIFLSTKDYHLALLWAMAGGFLLGLFSFLPFGVFILTLILLVFSINFLVKNFFTHYSFFSLLILSLISISFYNFLLIVISKLLYLIKIIDFNFILDRFYFQDFIWQLIINLIFISFLSLFTLLNAAKRQFRQRRNYLTG